MTIPDRVYRLVERKLRGAGHLREQAERRLADARARAAWPSSATRSAGKAKRGRGQFPDAGSIRPGGKNNSQETKMLDAVQAWIDLQDAEAWEEVIRDTDREFPPGNETGTTARLYYRRGMSQTEICEKLHIDRQTVRRRRDTYVTTCALYAAAAGLIDMKEADG